MATHTSKIVYDLTQSIVRGELLPDTVLTEGELAERFGVSRTPVRQALVVLSEEGLLRRSKGRSYTVRRFGPKEMLDAIDVRGVLEGLAVRQVIEHKMGGVRVVRELDKCLEIEEELLRRMEAEGLGAKVVCDYFTLNTRFHKTIIQGAQNAALAGALETVCKIPFVSVGSLARYRSELDAQEERQELRFFIYSHLQHRDIVDAIRTGQGARAERLMTEHAQLAARNIEMQEDEPLLSGTEYLTTDDDAIGDTYLRDATAQRS